jgi:RNA polymerase sigma-70 factor (ECF subfamily)
MNPADTDQTDHTEDYLRLLNEHERWLATHVHSLVSNWNDAADILQEVKLTLWRQFGKFEPGTNFRAWARTIATHQILNYRRASQKRQHVDIDDAFIQAVAAEIDRRGDVLDARSDALQHCLRKLPEAHRKIVLWRYNEDCEIPEIAAKSGRTVDAVYRLLSRIRQSLSECISDQLSNPS